MAAVAPAEEAGFHPGHSPWAVALTVTIATFMEVLDTSIANVALPHVAGGLAATPDEATWVLTSYLVSNAVVLPTSAWLALRLGRKRFYMGCVALFTVSSLLCGLAPSLGWLIFFRVLQGAGGGGLAPSEQSILADTFAPSKRGMAFAIYGMAVVVAPAVGPTLGGYITDNVGWRWIFFLNVPVGVLSLALTQRMVRDPPHLVGARHGKKVPIDVVGLVLITLGFGALQIVLDKGQEEDWFGSSAILWLSIASGAALVATVLWERRHPHPIVDLALFQNRNFAIASLLMFVLGLVLYSSTVLLPLFEQQFMGYSAQSAGMTLSPGALFIILAMPLVGFLVSRVQARWLVAFGFVVTALALHQLESIEPYISFRTAVLWRVYQSAGLGFLFVPINTTAYVGVAPEKRGDASGLINLMRNIGGSVGISMVTTLIARRMQVHQTMLAAHTSALDPALRLTASRVAHLLAHAGVSAADSAKLAYAELYRAVGVQAASLAYVDTFRLLAVASAVMIPMALLLKANRTGEGAAPLAH